VFDSVRKNKYRPIVNAKNPGSDESDENGFEQARESVRIGFLRVVDHDDIDRGPGRYQFQPKLLLDRRED
jgi:hypothetical protein